MKHLFTFLLLFVTTVGIAQISGTVYRDFNSNGVKDNTATYNEVGLQGVTVKAFNATGTQVGSTVTTGTDGTYTIAGVSGATRVEFTGLLNQDFSSFSGSGNGTSVQFVTAPATNVDFGVSYPQAYCGPTNSPNPDVAITCFINGEASGTDDVLVSFEWNESGEKSTNTIVKDADNGTIGSVWGTAYDRDNEKLYTAAFLKRHVELGGGGLGAIYLTDYSGAGAGTTTSTPVVTISNAGTVSNRDVNVAKDQPSRDPDAFVQVGKVGLGGIEVSPDGSTLWAVNLNTKAIVPVAISGTTGTEGTAISIPNPGCGGNAVDWRPFGLTYHREALYAGGVCSGETGGAGTMRYYVYRYDLASSTWDTNPLIDESLSYNKGYAFKNECDGWNPWITNFNQIQYAESDGDFCHPQAMLSDIAFDVDDDMILIFMDRFGHQTGRENFCPDPSNNCTADGVTRTGADWNGVVGGDILRADLNPANSSYTIESGGNIGSDGCGSNTGSVNNNKNVPEYYCGDSFGNGSLHAETIQGTGIVLAGSGEIMTSNIDPLQLVSGGMIQMNNKTGAQVDQIELYVTGFSNTGTFAKSNGLGEVDLLCANPPLEIGNRVWFDTNENGVQDAGEMSIDGVEIELYAGATATGSPIATTTTANGGQWYFNSITTSGLTPNADYVIKVKTALDNGALVTYTAFTTQNATASNGEDDLGDSDANASGEITYRTGGIGANDHSLDIGVTQAITCTTPTATASATNATCNGGTANSDASITIAGFTAGQRYQYTSGATFTGTATPAIITAIPTGGIIVNNLPNAAATFTVRIYDAADDNCFVDRTVNITLVDCTIPCTTPTATATAANATCNGGTANSDASITIAGFTAGQRHQYTSGATFTGTATPAAITAIPAGGVIVNNLPNAAATYTVRIYDAADDNCFVDRTVNITLVDCTVPCVTPDAGEDVTICLPKTTSNLKDAVSGTTQWTAPSSGNPAPATIDPLTGVVTGMTATGVYTFSLETVGDPTCKDDVTITVTNGDAPNVLCNDGSTSVTLEAPNNLTNVIWYSIDGTEVGTGNQLVVTSNTGGLADGTEAYYYIGEDVTATNACQVELCCPVKFITQDCCPTPNCASVTVIRN